MIPVILVIFFIILFFIFLCNAVDLEFLEITNRKTLTLALIYLLNAVVVFGSSFIPIKTNSYTVNLKDSLVFDDEKPYESLKIEEWTPLALFGGSLRFTSYSEKGILPDDRINTKLSSYPIRFKKGKKNCIHYKKKVNIFGDESESADNIVIEYKAS